MPTKTDMSDASLAEKVAIGKNLTLDTTYQNLLVSLSGSMKGTSSPSVRDATDSDTATYSSSLWGWKNFMDPKYLKHLTTKNTK